ncbi:MAG: hypothetical protein Q8M05_03535 [Rhodoferax sp.]|uniref:hypothetical protein n=1 Tax=Rhodoferax sp. TaxID=50421 RepID=UPI0027312055|nr:hypothetical protein [Rhodoferax sp.]MDP1528433.1 hypothetical protein [Rhodoferax sp.]
MTINHRLTTIVSIAAFGLAAAACTPANTDQADGGDTHTVVETVEVPGAPIIIDREAPPIVIDGQPAGDSTTVRADRDGISVETTNR